MKISVIMTVYDKEQFLSEALDSILNQSYSDFELIIVVECGANDSIQTAVCEYKSRDERVRLIYNKERLGLAESLNVGILSACGEYIARMDDDDISYPERFVKQVKLLDDNPDIGICGTFQKTIRPDSEDDLICAFSPDDLKAEMLFGCQLTHTSVMFRRELFLSRGWHYDGSKMAEDFALWSEIINQTKMANVPEVLVAHRYGFGNISEKKGQRLYLENVETIKNNISRNLHLDISKWSDAVFCPWRSFPKELTKQQMWQLIFDSLDLLISIERSNKLCKFTLDSAMTKALSKRYCWILNNIKKYLPIRELAVLVSLIDPEAVPSFESAISDIVNNLAKCFSNISTEPADILKSKMNIDSGKRIIIYGQGQAFRSFFDEFSITDVRNKYDIIGVTDSNSSDNYFDLKFIPYIKIVEYDFDYILISTGKYYMEIKNQLINCCNIKSDKIGLLDQIVLSISEA